MEQWTRFRGKKAVFVLCLAVMGLLLAVACSRQASNTPSEDGSQVAANDQASNSEQPATEAEPEPQSNEPQRQAEPPRRTEPAPVHQAPAAPPVPKTVAVTVPESTPLNVKLEDNLNSGVNHEGDTFRATLTQAIIVGDRVVLPEGSTIEGTLTSVVPAKKGLKESGGAMTLSFDRIMTPTGNAAEMAASFSKQAKSTGKKAGTIGGSAAGGALLGKVLGGSSKDAAIGAVVGGAVGTGVAANTKGSELKLEAGTPLTITLERPMTLHLKR